MGYQMRTERGYDFFEASSTLQKAIRRGDYKMAGYFALELFASGYSNYVWKRLLTVSAEDVEEFITREIVALHYSFTLINTPKPKDASGYKGRIFISKAVIILCKCIKSRESDHLQNLVYDKKISVKDYEIEDYFDEVRKENPSIPDYAYDVHTGKGKKLGKTKKMFFLEEQEALDLFNNDLFDKQLKEYLESF